MKENYLPDGIRPDVNHYTVIYYYKNGKVVGERKWIDCKTVYYDLSGIRRETNIVDELEIEYSVKEKVVDKDAYNKAIDEYNAARKRGRDAFVADVMKEYDLSIGEVHYFLDQNGSFKSAEADIIDFVDYRERF